MPFLSREAERFCLIAEQIAHTSGESYTRLASKLDVSVGTIRSVISRMTVDCGADVVETRSERGATVLMLTEAGKLLHSRLLKFARSFAEELKPPRLSVAIAPTMITSGLLDDMLESLRDLDSPAFELCSKTQLPFDQIVAGLHARTIDGAIVWGVEQRLRSIPDSLHVETLVPAVDVVIVARDQTIINRVAPCTGAIQPAKGLGSHQELLVRRALASLSDLRYATLPTESQALSHLLPTPDRKQGGVRFEVDTIETALAFVRTQAVDFAIVPAMYDRLEREKQHGNWVFSEPVSQIPIVVVSRNPIESDASSILFPLLNQLRWDSRDLWFSRKSPTDRFPRSIGFYTKLRYGYYIGADVRTQDAPLQWCWESIRLTRDTTDGTRNLQGWIVNQFNANFEVSAAQFRDTFFIAQVKPVGRGKNRMKEFFSRFHFCDFKAGIICGTWSGNARGDRSGVFATVWSHQKLCLSELRRVTRIADLHSVMSAPRGCENKAEQTDLVSGVEFLNHEDEFQDAPQRSN